MASEIPASAEAVAPGAAAPALGAEAQVYQCRLCGLGYTLDKGRVHGKVFMCTACNTHDRALRRNLGSQTELQQWSAEETQGFFRKLAQKKSETSNGRLQWATVRAVLVTSMTERTVMSFKGQIECSELPLSVYVQQGWCPDVVQKCPKVWSDHFGLYCYQVPIKKQTWAQCFERLETKILQQEKEVTKLKGKGRKGGDDDDIDVPVVAPAGDKASSSKQEAKKAAAEEKKLLFQNHKIGTAAAKALGALVQAEGSLRACEEKAVKADVGDSELAVSRPLSAKLQTWTKAAREAVNAQECNKEKPEGAQVTALIPLPWDQEDWKATLKQAATVGKALKDCLPKKLKRTAETPAAAGTPAAAAPSKRRRAKAAP